MRLSIILVAFLLVSCHPLFCDWESGYTQVRIRPSNDRLIGNYRLTESSIEFLNEKGFDSIDYRLILLADGKFQFVNAPNLIFDESKQGVEDREGKWSMGCGESYDCVVELEDVGVFPLAEGDGQLAILITIGDGDECNGVVYEKVD